MRTTLTNWQLALAAFIAMGLNISLAADQPVAFQQIRTLLSDRCYQCHGPDENSRKADLRLDLSEGADSVIEAGNLDNSELFQRISASDESQRMPPPHSKLELSPEEIQLIARWIEEGAHWQEHWAFEPLPVNVDLPKVRQTAWPGNEIDYFILSRLESKSIDPSRPAPRWRWLRRATFDITGLPPTPAEIEEFENDKSPDAYEKVTDRLLASPAYGQHMAVAWLDAARYADSYGYQSDKLNTQWPYRDWVVQAFNDNLPYDDFITWQLAGDLLDNPSRQQTLATAFNRLHRLSNEGGSVFEEWRVENIADRVHTYGTAVLGLTVECARCHDHKFDPISARDYYSLFAFFNSIDENGLYDSTTKVPSPTMLLPTDDQQNALKKARRELAAATDQYLQAIKSSPLRMKEWIARHEKIELEIPDQTLAFDFDTPFEENKKGIYYPSTDAQSRTDDLPREQVDNCPIPRMANQGNRMAIAFDGDRGITTKGVAPIDRWTPFSIVITLRERRRLPLRSVIAHHSQGTDAGYNGWDLTIENGFVQSRLYRVWPGNAIAVRSIHPIPVDTWHQLTATYDGSSTAAGLRIYVNGAVLPTDVQRDGMIKRANVNSGHGGQLVIGQRFRARGFAGGLIDDVRFYQRPLTATEIKHLATGAELELTPEYFASAIDQISRTANSKLSQARKNLVMAEEVINEIPIMKELPQSMPAHVLARGQYDAPISDETLVGRNTFEKIGPRFPVEFPRNRLGLARWTTLPNHPLTARVFVNRLWNNFFGTPLVGTPENFGRQGALPTHPQLLDWLARDFVREGWNIKRLSRKIVLSSTYRQDSAATLQTLKIDPENKWLGRGPAYRLAAEQIRDLALASSGLLNPEIGGAPVSPYQPGGDLWKENNGMSPPFRQSVGKSLHRRSLYSVWKRTAPLPNMTAFDRGSREVCTVSRSRTNTPLQALVLLNDTQFVEAARAMATHVIVNEISADDQIISAFLSFSGRRPDSDERALLLKLLAEEQDYYENNPVAAEKLVAVGEFEVPNEMDKQELAAMTTVCQAILNLDATIWKR